MVQRTNIEFQNYWGDISNQELINLYLIPHAEKCEDEGYHIRAIIMREAIRRLENKS